MGINSFSSTVPAVSVPSSDAADAACWAGFDTMRAADLVEVFGPRPEVTELSAERASSSKMAGFTIAAVVVFFLADDSPSVCES